MPVFGYSRESTWDQENGLEVQMEQVRAYWSSKLADVEWGGFHTDRAVSGSKPFRKRTSGSLLDALLTKGDHVVVSKLDRGFRDTLDFLSTERDWRDRGVKLHVLDLPFLSAEVPEYIGDMIRTVLALFAQFERARIRQRTKDVMSWMRSRNLRNNQYAGMGFEWVKVDGVYERQPCQKEQDTMRWICEQREAGVTWRNLYLLLLKERTKEGKQWSMSRIQRAAQAWASFASPLLRQVGS